jgi:acyl-CoA synthetase (NDP forming)
VPCFGTPETCADAVAAAVARRTPRDRALIARPESVMGERVLDEVEAYGLLDELGVPRAPTFVLDGDAEPPSELPFPFPVVAKVVSAAIPHKSDAGGVVIGIEDGRALADAVQQIRRQVGERRPDVAVDRIAVQSQCVGVGEVLVGFRRDPKVGPLLVLAAGGELAELYHDRSLRLAPIDEATALEMVGEVRALAVLRGFRSRPPGDLDALAAVMVALSRLADRPDVMELEVNPLIVRTRPDGVVAVDALARLT